MGYEINRFIDQDTASNCMCPICFDVFCIGKSKQEPSNGKRGGHKFCEECIENWLQQHNCCPVCRNSLNVNDLKDFDASTTRLHKRLKIHCKYQKEGCQFVGNLESIEQHESNCYYVPTRCIKCNLWVPQIAHSDKDCIFNMLELLKSQNISPKKFEDVIEILKNDVGRLFSEQVNVEEELMKLQRDFKILKSRYRQNDNKILNTCADIPELIKLCTFENNYERIKKLIERDKANVNYKDINGRTPLLEAVEHSNINIINLLIKHGANVNYKNNNTHTPLILAVIIGNLDVVKLLVESGAYLEGRNNVDDIVLFYAEDKIKEYLKSKGLI